MRTTIAIAFAFLSAISAFAQDSEIGITLAGLNGSPDRRVQVAKELGAAWYLPEPVLLGTSDPTCADCEPARTAGLKLLIVIRNSAAPDKPSEPIKDTNVLQQKLRAIIERYKPELLVVETEPDQPRSYSGSPQEYVAELKLSCDVAHAMKIKCANGGISSGAVVALAADELWKSDEIAAANLALTTEAVRVGSRESLKIFGKSLNTSPEGERKRILDATKKYLNRSAALIARARAIVAAAESAGADSLNFHWYELVPENIPRVADTMHNISRLPLMSDELGQRNERPFETGEKLRTALNSFIRPVVWAGVDGPEERVGLLDRKGNRRANATAFEKVAKQRTNPQ